MKRKLGEICRIVSGSTPKTGIPEYWDGDLKWVTPAELNDESRVVNDTKRTITELGATKTGLTPLPAGTVLLSSRAPIGKVAITGCEMYCNQGFKNLICSNSINNKYLYWFLKGKTQYLNSLGRGATFKEISKTIVADIEINLPDIEEQKKIANRIEKIDSRLIMLRAEISRLDELTKARFVEMFGDVEDHIRFGDCCSKVTDYVASGSFASLKENVKYGPEKNYAIMVRTVDFANDFKKDLVYTDKHGYDFLHNSNLFGGELLLSNIGASIGKVHRVPYLNYPMTLAPNAIMASANDNNLDDFLQYFFISELGQSQLKAMTTATAMPKFNKTQLKEVLVPKVPLEEQKRFSDFAKQVDKSKFAVQKSLEKTQQLFDSLMQEYFG